MKKFIVAMTLFVANLAFGYVLELPEGRSITFMPKGSDHIVEVDLHYRRIVESAREVKFINPYILFDGAKLRFRGGNNNRYVFDYLCKAYSSEFPVATGVEVRGLIAGLLAYAGSHDPRQQLVGGEVRGNLSLYTLETPIYEAATAFTCGKARDSYDF